MTRVLLLLFAVLVLAGCGSTTTVVTKTRYVHPCVTEKAMNRCVAETVAVLQRVAGRPAEGIKASCSHKGTRWLCTVALTGEMGEPVCIDTRLKVTLTERLPVLFDSSENLDGGCSGMVQ